MTVPAGVLHPSHSRWDVAANGLLLVAMLLSPVAWSADTDGDGIPDDVEVTEGRNPGLKDNDIFTVNRLFAMQQYRDFLGREGDAGGITFYTDLLTNGPAVRANVIESFFNSPEFGGTVSPIARLYFATFLRIPDYAGLQFQVEAYRTGTALTVIANNFTLSPEFLARYGALSDPQYVALLYANILGRGASQPEIDFHVNRLATGATRGDVLAGFSESPEYQANTSSDVYVTMMYIGMLRRAPEQGGFDFWRTYMNTGNPGINLILGFLNAPEYRDRFLPVPATLTVTRSGNGSGSVTSAPPGIDCGTACAASYDGGTQVSLTATASVGSTFSGWGGACAGTGACDVTMDSARTVSAGFTLDTHALTVSLTGNGAGTVGSAPPGIACGADCTEMFDFGTVVALTPAAGAESTFSGWGGACAGTGACNVTMDAAKSVSAGFTLNTYVLTVGLAGSGFGSVSSSLPGIACGADCVESYDTGTVITLTASPGALSAFGGWSGACAGTGLCTVTMDAVKNVIAAFTLDCGATCFVEPFAADGSLPPTPASGRLALATPLQKVDVGLIVDTTGSMGGELVNLKASLSTAVIPALQARVPDLGVGVAGHDDFPYSTYGVAGDLPFYMSASGFVTTNAVQAQIAVNALATHNGSDDPESHLPAIYHALTGSGLSWPGGSIPAVAPPAGTFGAMHFRSGALPIIVSITDAGPHNGKRALDKTGTNYDTAFQNPYSFMTYNADDVVTQLNLAGAKFIGIAAAGSVLNPYDYHAYLTDKTGSSVPPGAFTLVPGCVAGQCCTGVNGAGVAPDGPTIGGVQQCRPIFSVASTGAGLGASVVNGVIAVLDTLAFDIHVQAYNDAAEVIDVVGNFVQRVEPDPAGGIDPVSGGVCVAFAPSELADDFTGPKALVPGPDGFYDTIRQVNPDPVFCFNLVPKANTTVAPLSTAQVFRAWLRIVAVKPSGGTLTLGEDREVLFIVPPVAN